MRRAFSLVEISVVLVIISLLVGGVLTGQSLIRAGQLRAIVSEASQYTTAFNSFATKYGSYPGDFATATRYWGAIDSNAATCRATANTGPATCNGNGDGYLKVADSASVDYAETFHAWKQMANEGLIGGTYNGKSNAGAYTPAPGINTPVSAIDGATFSFWSNSADGVILSDIESGSWYPSPQGNVMFYGIRTTSGAPTGGLLTGTELAGIDGKIDDGYPATGDVRTAKSNTSCVTSTDPTVAKYTLTSSTTACYIFFWISHPS